MHLSQQTLEFLKQLKANNNREWFAAHKHLYEQAHENVLDLTAALIAAIGSFDETVRSINPKDCIFRIYRDTRFSKDKTPYKPNFGAHITPSGKGPSSVRSGYYIHVEPGGSFIGGGAYHPDGPRLQGIRDLIVHESKEFLSIVEAPDFKRLFGAVQGEKLKNPPKGYEKDHPMIEYLKHKDFYVGREIPDSLLVSDKLIPECVEAYKIVAEFNEFVDRPVN